MADFVSCEPHCSGVKSVLADWERLISAALARVHTCPARSEIIYY